MQDLTSRPSRFCRCLNLQQERFNTLAFVNKLPASSLSLYARVYCPVWAIKTNVLTHLPILTTLPLPSSFLTLVVLTCFVREHGRSDTTAHLHNSSVMVVTPLAYLNSGCVAHQHNCSHTPAFKTIPLPSLLLARLPHQNKPSNTPSHFHAS